MFLIRCWFIPALATEVAAPIEGSGCQGPVTSQSDECLKMENYSHDGTVNSVHRMKPKNAVKHSVSIVRSSAGLKQPLRNVLISLERMSNVIGYLVGEDAGRLFSSPLSVRRTAGIESKRGDEMDLRRYWYWMPEVYDRIDGGASLRMSLR
ncbi:UNVERIFIED_CONTAM: hypothetical protein FKN15_070277 [Acipenser sinensis]